VLKAPLNPNQPTNLYYPHFLTLDFAPVSVSSLFLPNARTANLAAINEMATTALASAASAAQQCYFSYEFQFQLQLVV